MAISLLGSQKQKDKGTFISPTFKFRENKASLLFSFLAPRLSYGNMTVLEDIIENISNEGGRSSGGRRKFVV